MSIPLIDAEKLIAVMDDIVKYPFTFKMSSWGSIREVDERHPCGSDGCLAGNIIAKYNPGRFKQLVELAEFNTSLVDVEETTPHGPLFMKEAASIIGLTLEEADELFFVYNWPKIHHESYRYSATFERKADAAKHAVLEFLERKTLEGRVKAVTTTP